VLQSFGHNADVFAVQVDGHGCDVLSASPVYRADGLSRKLQVANLGLLGKMTGGAAILETRYTVRAAQKSGTQPEVVESKDEAISKAINAQAQGRDSLVTKTSLKALGTLGLWLDLADGDSGAPKTIDIDEDVMVLLEGRAVPRGCVSFDGQVAAGAQVLQIDLAAAWNEMGLKAGYANEVDVAVYVWV